MAKNILPLDDMASRHTGLTISVAASYLEAARVCLDRHHQSPTEFALIDSPNEVSAEVVWEITDDQIKRAWANKDDATRDGAYAMAIASAELVRKLVAVQRAETKTGADYYLSLADDESDDIEDWIRLEVSGTDLDEYQVRYRLTQKVKQAQAGNSNLPALATVIGFKVKQILMQSMD